MKVGGLLGHQQDEDLRNRLAVGGVEGDRLPQADERAARLA